MTSAIQGIEANLLIKEAITKSQINHQYQLINSRIDLLIPREADRRPSLVYRSSTRVTKSGFFEIQSIFFQVNCNVSDSIPATAQTTRPLQPANQQSWLQTPVVLQLHS